MDAPPATPQPRLDGGECDRNEHPDLKGEVAGELPDRATSQGRGFEYGEVIE
jgi:hypothetical protein